MCDKSPAFAACDTTRTGCSRYVRRRDLLRLLPVKLDQIDSGLLADDRFVARLLGTALAREAHRGRWGHWCYDPARHRLLAIAYRGELAALSRRQSSR